MAERNEKEKPPPATVYHTLRQVEDLLCSLEEEDSTPETKDLFKRMYGPESLLWQKRQVLKTSLLVRKQWKSLPEAYFAPLMRLAVYEPDPGLNREFIEPALRAFGYRRVQEALLDYLAQGMLREKAGAARACYWAWLPIVLSPNPGNKEFRRICDEGLWARRDILLLKTFVENEDLDVRRSIISHLSLRPSDYPEAYSPSIPTAIHLARTHPDESIRRKVEIVLQRQHLDI